MSLNECGRRVTMNKCGRRVTMTVLAIAAMVGSGCGAVNEVSTPTSPTPATVTVTEQFEGSIVQAGSATHAFVVTTTGSVSIQLTTVGPLATMALGVGLGTWNGTSCLVSATVSTIKNDNARAGVVALAGTAVAGNYCARIYDPGNVPSDWTVTYTVAVTHP